MKLLANIRALFTRNQIPEELSLAAAEICGNKVYLHPAEDRKQTICMPWMEYTPVLWMKSFGGGTNATQCLNDRAFPGRRSKRKPGGVATGSANSQMILV